MHKQLAVLFLVALVAGCKNKKVSLKGDESVGVADFIEFFPEVTLPYRVADSTLAKKTNDSLQIGEKVFSQFIPDSVLRKEFGNNTKPKFYALGRTREKGKETYLYLKAVSAAHRVVYLVAFSKDQKFLDALPLVRSGDGYINAYGLLDNKFQVTAYREKKKPGGGITYKKDVYIFNSAANSFTLILTEPNEEIIQNIINPIDTFPAKHKYSGDFIKDKRNFVSVRDGKNSSALRFFIHFEKNSGPCTGELKGIAILGKSNVAQYQEPGNPCLIEFTFGTSSVDIRELGGCGSYRGVTCLFEGTYPKKKPAKPRIPRKKT